MKKEELLTELGGLPLLSLIPAPWGIWEEALAGGMGQLGWGGQALTLLGLAPKEEEMPACLIVLQPSKYEQVTLRFLVPQERPGENN